MKTKLYRSNYHDYKPEDFKWEEEMARPVMYCFRLSDYGELDEDTTYEIWTMMEHAYRTDRRWFNGLYEYMMKVIDKVKEIGYDAIREADIEKGGNEE